jgi:DNA-binding MarR family transcriptional regulator
LNTRARSTGYTTIENECFLDARLSPEAVGVLCFLRHTPDTKKLAKRFRYGKGAITRVLKELVDAGYILETGKQ